ncbi:MAG: NTP transferase domain-containing protein, partial [Planctomycetota bacterium]|nr:NTP transferase domain-containing protein [Planctomycetota bacterium]
IDDPELTGCSEIADARARGELRLVAPERGPSASVASMFGQLEGAQTALVTTADHPLLEPAMIAHFVDEAARVDADVVVGVVAEETLRARYPDVPRTFLGPRPTRVTGANLFLLRTPRAARAVAFWQEMDARRKQPWRLVSRIGLGSLARYALGRLDLDEAVRDLSERAGARAALLALPFPECALDVDRPEHLSLIEEILTTRRSG